jgi:hypothetical protein
MTGWPTKAAGNGKYEVGYGKPPQHSQFQPGKSGNPKGRPRGRKTSQQMLQAALDGACTVTEGGVTKKMSNQQVVYMVVVKNAMNGNPKMAGLLFKLMHDHDMTRDMDPTFNKLIVTFVRPDGDKKP